MKGNPNCRWCKGSGEYEMARDAHKSAGIVPCYHTADESTRDSPEKVERDIDRVAARHGPRVVNAQIASQGYSQEKGKVPEVVARMAYEVYHHMHSGQSFERLHERGGFGVGELIGFLYARNFPKEQWRDRFDEAIRGLVSR